MALTASTLNQRATKPAIVARLGNLYYSSRDTFDWSGNTWTAAGLTKRGPDKDGSGRESIELTLYDNSTTWPALILAGLDSEPCHVYLLYWDSSGAIEEEDIFDGVIDSASVSNDGNGQMISFRGIRQGPDVTWTPRIAWRSDFAVTRGSEITINNEVFLLE